MVRPVDPVTPTRIGETVGADGNRVLALDPFSIRYGRPSTIGDAARSAAMKDSSKGPWLPDRLGALCQQSGAPTGALFISTIFRGRWGYRLAVGGDIRRCLVSATLRRERRGSESLLSHARCSQRPIGWGRSAAVCRPLRVCQIPRIAIVARQPFVRNILRRTPLDVAVRDTLADCFVGSARCRQQRRIR
jgi:hypothetical protein